MRMKNLLTLPSFMADHRWTRAHISDEIDGLLDPGQHDRLARHVADCRRCRRLLDSMRRTVGVLGRIGVPARPGIADRTVQRLKRE